MGFSSKAIVTAAVLLLLTSNAAAAENDGLASNIAEGLIEFIESLLPIAHENTESVNSNYSYKTGFSSNETAIVPSPNSPGYFSIKEIYLDRKAKTNGKVTANFEVKNFGASKSTQTVNTTLNNKKVGKTLSLEPNETKRVSTELPSPENEGSYILQINTHQETLEEEVTVEKLPLFDVLVSRTKGYNEGDNITVDFEITNNGASKDAQSYWVKTSAVEEDIVGEITLEPGESATKDVHFDTGPGTFGRHNITVKTPRDLSRKTVFINQDIIGNIDHFITPYKVNGNPQNQVNILIHGDKISGEKLRDEHLPELIDAFTSSHMGEHSEKFNWYYLDIDASEARDRRICGESIRGDGSTDGCPFMEDGLKFFESSDTINGGRISRNILSNREFRSYAWRSTSTEKGSIQYTSIPYQVPREDYRPTFLHEIGHSVFGLSDEYDTTGEPSLYRTYIFPEFYAALNQNAWNDKDACESTMRINQGESDYEEIGVEDCECHRNSSGGCTRARIRAGDGASFMENSDSTLMYENHKKRIQTVFDEHNEQYN